jgi:hypothetical protein
MSLPRIEFVVVRNRRDEAEDLLIIYKSPAGWKIRQGFFGD